jgi:IS30 family transposase
MVNMTEKKIKIIENRLDNRPRKRLGLRTPIKEFVNIYLVLHFVLEPG